jgi:hypothetical protein
MVSGVSSETQAPVAIDCRYNSRIPAPWPGISPPMSVAYLTKAAESFGI